jgi:hypothetical protein
MANPQQPNIANLNAAINGMATDGNTITQGLQSFTNHQQALGTELSLFGNTPLGQIHQQLATIQATILTMQTTILQLIDLSAARDWNMNAKFENAKVYQVTGGLVAMRSVDRAPNAQVLINHPIANFPPTADGVSQLTGIIHTHYGSLFFKLR